MNSDNLFAGGGLRIGDSGWNKKHVLGAYMIHICTETEFGMTVYTIAECAEIAAIG